MNWSGKHSHWAQVILEQSNDRFPIPIAFEHLLIAVRDTALMAIYNVETGYVELYPGNWGYDSNRNRWANGEAPPYPLEIKKIIRLWIRGLDRKHGNI